MEKDMTSGSPLKLIFWFSIPVLLGNIFQQFYNMADAIIVGRLLGEDALAAVGATGSIMFLVLYFAMESLRDLVSWSHRHMGQKMKPY